MTFVEQLKNNQLAIISLLVAFTALGYNTWRNEQTEANRTVRQAGFEILVHAGEMQRITYLAHYDKDLVEGNPRKGWTEVLIIKDLATLMPEQTDLRASELHNAWEQNWNQLGKREASVVAIDTALDQLRRSVLVEVADLD